MSALFGHQPEFDVGENQMFYGAIRYDKPRPLSDMNRAGFAGGSNS